MTETEFYQRQEVLREAISWLGTPYHHAARVKGEGIDCAWFLADVFANTGLIPRQASEYYPPDWHIHQTEERYLNRVLQFADLISTQEEIDAWRAGGDLPRAPLPADVVMFDFGKCRAHGAIVFTWPQLVHAQIKSRVELVEAYHATLREKFAGVYRYKGWAV
jgi:cell wall-associated NlpC family hydrolase